MPRPVIRASSVLARSSGEAIASLRPAEDGPHAPQTPEYFEWWYFDHHFDNGYTAVVVFHRATAFLPSHPPAVEITVITPAGEELRSFRTLSPAEFRVAAGPGATHARAGGRAPGGGGGPGEVDG